MTKYDYLDAICTGIVIGLVAIALLLWFVCR